MRCLTIASTSCASQRTTASSLVGSMHKLCTSYIKTEEQQVCSTPSWCSTIAFSEVGTRVMAFVKPNTYIHNVQLLMTIPSDDPSAIIVVQGLSGQVWSADPKVFNPSLFVQHHDHRSPRSEPYRVSGPWILDRSDVKVRRLPLQMAEPQKMAVWENKIAIVLGSGRITIIHVPV